MELQTIALFVWGNLREIAAVLLAVLLAMFCFPHWFGLGPKMTYYRWNMRWLKLCCFFGYHHWVYDHAEKVRVCKHNWCAAREEKKR